MGLGNIKYDLIPLSHNNLKCNGTELRWPLTHYSHSEDPKIGVHELKFGRVVILQLCPCYNIDDEVKINEGDVVSNTLGYPPVSEIHTATPMSNLMIRITTDGKIIAENSTTINYMTNSTEIMYITTS